MLGRKIIQVYPDENTLSTPPTQTGLSVRRIKSAGLRIVTVGDMNSADTLQVCAIHSDFSIYRLNQPHKVPQSKHGPSSACPVSAM